MNMLMMSQYQPRLSSITNVAAGESTNQIAVYSHQIRLVLYVIYWYNYYYNINGFYRAMVPVIPLQPQE
jgi:hypothetical protein